MTGYKIGSRKIKQKYQHSAARQHNEREEEATKHTAEKKDKTLADSNYFYTEKSITCTKFRVHVTPLTCTLSAQL